MHPDPQVMALVTDALPVLVAYVDTDCRYRMVNRAYEDWFGLTRDALAGKHFSEVLGDAAWEALRPHAMRALGGEVAEFEAALPYARGGTRFVHGRYLPHRGADGTVVGFVVLVEDISARRAAESALVEAHRHITAILASITDCFYSVDRDWIVQYFNDQASRYFGRAREDVLGQSLWALMDEAQHAYFAPIFAGAVARGVPEHFESTSPVTGRRVQVHLYPTEQGLSVVFRDVTEQRLAEEQLRRSEHLQAVGQLAGGVAHEVNNQMTVVLGFGQTLLARLPPSPERTRIEHMIEAAERTARITRQLLAFSRRQVLQPTQLDLHAVLLGFEPELLQLLGPGMTLRFELAGRLGVRADRVQLEQVLVNLAANARAAMPDGGSFHLRTRQIDGPTLRREAAFARLTAPADDRWVELTIEDSGVGMPPEVLARVFEPFFTTRPVGLGTGLGLPTVYGIVEQSGGGIRLESTVGGGTRVYVVLPLVEEAEVVAAPAAPTAPSPATGAVVLVVEDEPLLREILAETLTDAGYTVHAAADGAEALALLDGGVVIDALVTDLTMPRVNGRHLAEQVAQRRAVPVLFLSGHPGEDAIRRGILEPGAPFLQKPFTADALVAAVARLLEGRR